MDIVIPNVWSLNALFLELWDPNKDIYKWALPDGFNAQFIVGQRITEDFTYKGFNMEIGTTVRMPRERGRALGPNYCHSVDSLVDRELTSRCMFDPIKLQYIKDLLDGSNKSYHFSNKENIDMALYLQDLHNKTGMLSVRSLNYVDVDTIHIFGMENIEKLVSTLPNNPFPILSVFDSFRAHPNYVNDLRKQYNHILSDIAHSNLLNHILKESLGKDVNVVKEDTSWYKDIVNSNYALC